MSTDSLVLAIIGHLVGDYLLQNDWMAIEKKRNPMVATLHSVVWSMSVMMFSGWGEIQEWHGLVVFSCLVTPHFVQDHTMIVHWWMKLIGQEQFAKPPLAPWSVIVVDNVWHIVTLWSVWRWVV